MKQPRQDDEPSDPSAPADLRTMFARYRVCPAHSKPSTFLAFVRERNPHLFSHHARDRADYLDHVWHVGGLYVCRGCMTVIAFTPLAFAAALLTRWPVNVTWIVTGSIFAALLLLSLIPLRHGPRTPLHDLRRVALGCLLGSAAAYLLLCDDWLLRGVVMGVYVTVLSVRRIIRQRAAKVERFRNG